ncbi:LINE-1 retrotransposable element ORF2 protein [Eumeta japonica]|uniref:LINE-1 retrotransposable element ORF2 protein n=1 Tax=Eumeta variegata TaxID=151549 RepID=A0A4C1ZV97_EUMVA|nr:LINE-1 retrotransposable element ORF2 protein [Eumeta japonica]
MKDNRGKFNHNRIDILKTATSYYKNLYRNNSKQAEINLVDTSNTPSILQAEVSKAIDTQKREKAPGPDGISNEILRYSKEILLPVLTDMFNDITNTETIPQQWTKSHIILLYKKGDKYDIGNYRPISLMSNVYKIFAKIILKRIERTLDENQPKEQAGFRSDYSVIDHIHVVRQILEKYNEYQLTYYIAFIDYSKAFDSLQHAKIWEALLQQGIEHKYIRLIRIIYSRSTAIIELEKKSTPFRVEKGVRQGDPLSPKLFSAVLESVFRRLNWEHLGINIDGHLLSHLRFADDIVLLAKTAEDLTRMIKELAKESGRVGLTMNMEKTRVMTNGYKHTIDPGDIVINYTDEYVYLGQLITQKDPMQKEVDRRITNGWKRYWSLREAMKDKDLHINLKSKLFNTCILPVLTYGCHLVRGQDKWSKRVTWWYPREGKRKRGRPQKRWDDDVRRVAGVTWNRVAQERKEWKRLEEAFADWQTDLGKITKQQNPIVVFGVGSYIKYQNNRDHFNPDFVFVLVGIEEKGQDDKWTTKAIGMRSGVAMASSILIISLALYCGAKCFRKRKQIQKSSLKADVRVTKESNYTDHPYECIDYTLLHHTPQRGEEEEEPEPQYEEIPYVRNVLQPVVNNKVDEYVTVHPDPTDKQVVVNGNLQASLKNKINHVVHDQSYLNSLNQEKNKETQINDVRKESNNVTSRISCNKEFRDQNRGNKEFIVDECKNIKSMEQGHRNEDGKGSDKAIVSKDCGNDIYLDMTPKR